MLRDSQEDWAIATPGMHGMRDRRSCDQVASLTAVLSCPVIMVLIASSSRSGPETGMDGMYRRQEGREYIHPLTATLTNGWNSGSLSSA